MREETNKDKCHVNQTKSSRQDQQMEKSKIFFFFLVAFLDND